MSKATETNIIEVEEITCWEAEERGANWLESRGGFSRYWIGREESDWACDECGRFVACHDEDGCEHCGNGAPAEDEYEDLAA